MAYFFYSGHSDTDSLLEIGPLDAQFTFEIWRPSIAELVPPGLPTVPFGVWWLFDYLHVFSNRDYAIVIIRDGTRIVHRSGVFPRYFRFPFMTRDDLQIGDTWTHPDYRGRGMATSAIQSIVSAFRSPGRTFWYIVENDNFASIRVIEKTGFQLVGVGNRTQRFGRKSLGQYVIQESPISQS